MLVAAFMGLAASAAQICVGPAASGNGSGSDWNNLAQWSSITPARGNTYYLQDGTYGGKTISAALSGTTQIVIKKATPADHGTSTGWADSMGDGQSTLGNLEIDTGCVTIDGQNAYGFKISVADGSSGIRIGGSSSAPRNDITVRYVDVAGVHGDVPYNFATESRCIEVFPYTGSTFAMVTNLLVEYCNLHAVPTIVQIDQTASSSYNNITFQYNKMHDNRAASGYDSATMAHQNVVYATNTKRIVFRYNEVWNTVAVGFYPSYQGGYHEVYGNVVHDCDSFVWIYESGSQPGVRFYNNTVANVTYPYLDQNNLSTGSATNNLFYQCGGPDFGSNVAHDYNWYSGSSANGESHGVAGGSTSPFVSGGYTTVSTTGSTYPRDRGAALAAAYNTAINGVIRGADGAWDIGAYEYAGAISTNPVIAVSPSSRNFGSIAVGTTSDLSFTVQNTGGSTLTGTATVSAPFSVVAGGSYSLGANQSQTVTVRYSPTVAGSNTATVTFTGGGGAVATVSGAARTLSALNVSPVNPRIATGGSQQFSAVGTYSDGTTQNVTGSVTWSSSVPSVATISTGGLASGGAAGNTTISAALSGVSSSTILAVQAVASQPGGSTSSTTIWPSSAVPTVVDSGPDSSVELGVKFRSDVTGTIKGIRFYKASTNTGTHVGRLWSSTGTLLATATFTNETASGWQQVLFSAPVSISSNTVYVASYHANSGHYSCDTNYFASSGVDNPPLHALANSVSGGNSVYAYGSTSLFPNQTWQSANYWVDVVFQPAASAPQPPLAPTNVRIVSNN